MLWITFLVPVTKMNRKKIKSFHTLPLIFLNLTFECCKYYSHNATFNCFFYIEDLWIDP